MEAITWHRKALNAFAADNNEWALANVHRWLGDDFRQLDQYDEAYSHYLEAQLMSQKVGDLPGQGLTLNRTARLNLDLGRPLAEQRLPRVLVWRLYPNTLGLLGLAAAVDDDQAELLRALAGMVALPAAYLAVAFLSRGGLDVRLASTRLGGRPGRRRPVATRSVAPGLLAGRYSVPVARVRKVSQRSWLKVSFGPSGFLLSRRPMAVVSNATSMHSLPSGPLNEDLRQATSTHSLLGLLNEDLRQGPKPAWPWTSVFMSGRAFRWCAVPTVITTTWRDRAARAARFRCRRRKTARLSRSSRPAGPSTSN
jgi:hypothetical protein